MAIVNILENFNPETNAVFVEKAESLRPKLIKTKTKPISIVEIYKGKNDWECNKIGEIDELSGFHLGKSDKVCVDFGGHRVGYVRIKLSYVGSPPDAPAYIRVKLGEHLCEIGEETSDYNGIISSSWLQEEFLHIDILPADIRMPRRYAFRYLEILVKDTSPKFKIVIDSIECKAVSSVDLETVKPLKGEDTELNQIDSIAVKTLADCMQSVFEDGPKRDRRLWIGDLRLQALANYETFNNYDLVKRCLYLFAGLKQNRGRVGSCLYLEPEPHVDDTVLFDYSLFFISCLHDYYFSALDIQTLEELWDTAYRQIELSLERLDSRDVVRDSNAWWCFIDWPDELNKQAGAQAVFIYTLKQAKRIAKELKDKERFAVIDSLLNRLIIGAVENLWDEELGFFTSGKDKQISWASQVWFILAEVFDKEKNKELIEHLISKNPNVKMVTPYMYHYFIEALIQCGMQDEAEEYIKSYWGGMVKDGADCFYELYDPENKDVSPYGSRSINSYCHAWSCTPTYFIRKYLNYSDN